jgi:hypothetical protein
LEVRRRLLHQLHGERARRRAGGPLSRRQRAGSCVHHTASRESLGFGAAVAYGGCEDAGLVGAGVESGTAIADRPLHRVAAKGQGHRAAHQHRQARNWVADAARSSWCPPIQLLISLGIHHRPLKLYHSPWSARGYLRLDVFRGGKAQPHTCNFVGHRAGGEECEGEAGPQVELAKQFDAPLEGGGEGQRQRFTADEHTSRVRSAARALLNQYAMPPLRYALGRPPRGGLVPRPHPRSHTPAV